MKQISPDKISLYAGSAGRSRRFFIIIAVAVLSALLIAAVLIPSSRGVIRAALPASFISAFHSIRYSYSVDHKIRITMPDGVRLAASLYLPKSLPKQGEAKLPTVLIRLPYNRLEYGEGLKNAQYFSQHGYAVLLQDLRGKYGSEGRFIPYEFATSDGAATLDWIAGQPWSNGRVGTIGCSSLGETQYSLARARHPAHAAMIASGAGGGMGSAAGRYSYFGIFEGGIFQLSGGFGWFNDHGAKDPRAPPSKLSGADITAALRGLPVGALMRRAQPAAISANSYDDFLSTPLADSRWDRLDYVGTNDVFNTPALAINTWGDQTVGDAIALQEFTRQKMPPEIAKAQRMILAPGNHCDHDDLKKLAHFGDLKLQNKTVMQPYDEWYLSWFDYWLRGKGEGLNKLPAYLYYVIGENQWLNASQWPPEGVITQKWHLGGGGHANGAKDTKDAKGDGTLTNHVSAEARKNTTYDEFRYDPMNPVPSRGGPVCCTGNPADRSGPVDQKDVEQREDVLVYTSALLSEPMRIAGNLKAKLTVSSSALDTDIVARLVDVWPDGRATNIQEGALRLRYRNGIDRPALLSPNTPVSATIDMRAIAYYLPAGHKIRLHITSSSFPRLERNLNTGGNNFDETNGVVAINRIFHSDPSESGAASYVELPVLPLLPVAPTTQ